ncbi:MAG: GatB/YqeY domain-containing protein [Candidatus Binatia bacterium]
MATEAQLQEDLRAAMKVRAMEKVYTLRGLITAIKNAKVERRVATISEADIATLVRKEINKRAEAAEFAHKANRPQLAEQNDVERAVLEAYLPPQLTPDALETIVRDVARELSTTQIGPIMAKLRERHAGQFDGKLASALIRKLARGGAGT